MTTKRRSRRGSPIYSHLDLRVGVGPLEQEVLRLEVAVTDVVLVMAVLDPAQDARNDHLFNTGRDGMGCDDMGWDRSAWDDMILDGIGYVSIG